HPLRRQEGRPDGERDPRAPPARPLGPSFESEWGSADHPTGRDVELWGYDRERAPPRGALLYEGVPTRLRRLLHEALPAVLRPVRAQAARAAASPAFRSMTTR